MTTSTAVKDPVCGMDVEANTAARHAEYKEHTYYFCSAPCHEKFTLNPAEYVDRPAAMSKTPPVSR